MGYVVAGLIAAVLGAIEQYNRLRAKPTWSDFGWAFWILRVGLEGGTGVASVAIAIAAKHSLHSQPLVWIAAGAAGPVAVRTRIIDIGLGKAAQPVGLAAAYEPIRDWIARRIDDIGAARQSKWLTEELLPTLSRHGVPPQNVADRFLRWLQGSERFSKLDVTQEEEFIATTLAGNQSDDIKRELFVLRAVNLGAYRVLRDLSESCKEHQAES